jgi:glycerol-3-phosphate dehydrogenase
VQDISEGLSASRQDVDYLLDHYARRFRDPISRRDVVSVRCGIRPLAVDRQYHGDHYPLDLSRRQEVIQDADQPWISCYGGKITGCTRMASKALTLIKKSVVPSAERCSADDTWESNLEQMEFPGLSQPVPSAAWCAHHELCCTLEDYLRRRTNIAQWLPRGGFGKNDANAQTLKNVALDLAHGNSILAARLFETYRRKVMDDFDSLLTSN